MVVQVKMIAQARILPSIYLRFIQLTNTPPARMPQIEAAKISGPSRLPISAALQP